METIEPRPHTSAPNSASGKFDVAVIIVTYNSAEQIEECLNSVYEQPTNLNQEVIVVDNGSQDNTVDLIKDKFPQVKLHDTGQNLGFAKACNLAASKSSATYYLQLNPDTVVLDNAIERVIRFAREHPEYGFYGGRTLKEDGKTLERSSCWGLPSLWSLAMFATGLSTLFKHNKFFDPESLGSWKRDSIREVGVITGCFLLVSSEAWKILKGFDEHYWLYGEDVDLSLRAKKSGFRPVICPTAVVIHEVGQSSTSTQKAIWLHKGKVSYIKRNWSPLKSTIALLFLKSGILLRSTLFSLAGKKDNQWIACWKRRSEWTYGH